MESTPPSARIPAVDVLRGVAVLGMLAVTVGWFATPVRSLPEPGLSAEPRWLVWAWALRGLLLDDVVFTLVFMLFGAGLGLGASKGFGRQFWRQVTLLVIGAAHAYGLWFMDVLVLLAASGALVLILKPAPLGLIVLLGVLGALAPVFVHVGPRAAAIATGEELVLEDTVGPAESVIQRPADDYLAQVKWRAQFLHWRWSTVFVKQCTHCAGYMLLGLALFKLGFLTGAARRQTYALVAAAALPLGLGLSSLSFVPELDAVLGPSNTSLTVYFGSLNTEPVNELGAGLIALGVAALVLYACRSAVTLRLFTPVAALGRMALSGYLLQTLVCALVYEGWAGGHHGELDLIMQLQVAGGVAVGLLLLCPLWLAHFRYGPAEWLWRSLTYLRPQKMGVGSSS